VLQSTSMKGRNMDRVRVIRVLEYEGPRDWIEVTLAQNAVKGTRNFGGGCVIREATVGAFPAVVEEIKEVPYKRPAISKEEWSFMDRFGWEFTGGGAVKYDIQSGKVLAHEGDETWDRDLKVAGE